MRVSSLLRISVLAAAACLCVKGQGTPGNEAQAEKKGMPPRAAASDYQAQTQAGAVTIAAEFKGHSVPTLEGILSTEEYVVVETALFGAPDAKVRLSSGDFSLRINGKKEPLPSQPYGLVVRSVKDPEWEPPEQQAKSKSKTGLSGGGDDQRDSGPPAPVKVPIELQRAMAQHVQKVSLPEGDRALPLAGLIFFQYRGKTDRIRSIELIYAGPAGTATLTLQP